MSKLTLVGNTSLSFEDALNLVKQGKLVCRAGWNGKGMFIFMRPSDNLPLHFIDKVKSLPDSFKEWVNKSVDSRDGFLTFTSYLCMKAADNTIVNGWLASQTDMLANDWCELGFIE